jgi:ribonuclease BN (tRNA processing enzyme)
MRLTFLGTGSAMPTGERNQTGLLLESTAAGTNDADPDRLLVDCGSGVLGALARTDAGYETVDTVLLTHHHLDHVSDLLPLLKARWLAGEESLTVVGPEGTPELVAGLLEVHDYLQGRAELDLRTVAAGEETTVAGFGVSTMATRHSVPCLAYRFDHPEEPAEVVFSGDSEAFPDLAGFADGAALLAHDCSFPDGVDVSNHPTPTALGEALAAAGVEVGRVYLTHLYPHTGGREEEMLAAVGEHYGGDVRIARDGLTVELD